MGEKQSFLRAPYPFIFFLFLTAPRTNRIFFFKSPYFLKNRPFQKSNLFFIKEMPLINKSFQTTHDIF
jgi:hypothetical protein